MMVAAPRRDPAGACRSRAILLVEDEGLIRLSLADYLRDLGFEVLEAASGDQAKTLIQSKARIDLVFTDVQMPGQIDGLALARWLRETHPDVGIMITSGIEELTDRACELCERASVFAKPYMHAAVSARIRKLLH